MDIREILKSLSDEDRQLWSQFRTEMRRCFITAHTTIIGGQKWDYTDDSFIDMVDIKLALLFDRAGKINAPSDIIGADDTKPTEKDLEEAKIEVKPQSDAVKVLTNVWR